MLLRSQSIEFLCLISKKQHAAPEPDQGSDFDPETIWICYWKSGHSLLISPSRQSVWRNGKFLFCQLIVVPPIGHTTYNFEVKGSPIVRELCKVFADINDSRIIPMIV